MALAQALLALLLAPLALVAQYKADAAGAPPRELPANFARLLLSNGFKISSSGAPYCEIWFRAALPSGPASPPRNVTLPQVRLGALVGVIRFDAPGADRRGQSIQPGLYTLRYGLLPLNEEHQGAAPQRDFLLLTPLDDDRDPNATPDLDALAAMSRKASRTRHPAVLSFWKAEADSPGFSQKGDDWVLETKLGETPIAVILIGTAGS
jgi:hypothetical protein